MIKKIITFTIIIIAIYFFDYVKFVLPFGRLNILVYVVLIILKIISIISLFVFGIDIFIKYFKINKCISLLILSVTICAIGTIVVLPNTKLYIKINDILYYHAREEVIELLNNNEMEEYRIGINEYALPMRYRLISHTGSIFVSKEKNQTLFYIKCGYINRTAIIFSDGDVQNGDFNYSYYAVEKLSENRYFVKFRC